MQTQEVQFAVETKGNVVQKVGKSVVYVPKTSFKGGETKWYADKLKESGKEE